MKYEAEVDQTNRNTSHGLLLDLVGSDKRVLDVGCATGYLARALIARGCTVSGVELDAEAAEEARPVLKELLVGNLEELDLTDTFGQRAFDAIVFGDILEHLQDPLKVLRGSLRLLDEDGFVAISIPNVAHASVRLALLKGQFEYRELGLLDGTHLRFFTRESFDGLLRDAGLVAVDSQRTTAGFFETEIALEPTDFPPSLLMDMSSDPDVRTYQFVVKAVPADSSRAIRRLHEQVAEKSAEVRRLRQALDVVSGAEDGPVVPVQIGLWGHFALDDLRLSLLLRVVKGELARRLPGGTIRCFAPVLSPLRCDSGAPVEPLGPWSAERANALADQLDAVVVTGPLGVAPSAYAGIDSVDHALELDAVMYQGLGADIEDRCPVLCVGVEQSEGSPVGRAELVAALTRHRGVAATDGLADLDGGSAGSADAAATSLASMPDPLLLVDRLFGAEQLNHRGAYLRLMGWYPAWGPALVVQGDESLTPFAPALASALDEVAAAREARCVLLESNVVSGDASFVHAMGPHLQRAGGVVPIDAGVVDLLAAVANAAVLVTASPGLLAVAFVFGTPCIGLDLQSTGRFDQFVAAAGVPDLVIRRPSELPGALKHWPTAPVRTAVLHEMRLRIDGQFDRVAAIVSESAQIRRATNAAPLAVVSPAARLRSLEMAHRALQQRMAAERLAFADRAIVFEDRCRGELDQAQAAVAAAEAMIEAINATRTMRALRPAREMYARLRVKPK